MSKKSITLALALLATAGVASAEDLNVASTTGNVPFEFTDESGTVVGFEVDLVALISEKIGATPVYTEMPFNTIFSAVQSGRADIALGSITITAKRLESVSFTQPYYDANQCLTTSAKGDVKGLSDLKDKAVAVITGSTGEIWATEHQAEYGIAEVSKYDEVSAPMLDIATGRINAFIHDCPIDAYYIKDKPEYAIVATIPTNEQFGIMLAKDSPLLPKVDAAIAELKQSGDIARLHEKWFGVAPDAASSTVNVLPIPGK